MNRLIVVLLLVALAGSASHASRVVIEYSCPGVTVTVAPECDWAHVIFLKGVPPVVCWGHGPEPRSAGEALWRMEGLRNDGWTNATFERGEAK